MKAGWLSRDYTVKFYSGRVCWGTSQASHKQAVNQWTVWMGGGGGGGILQTLCIYSFLLTHVLPCYFATVRHLAHAYLLPMRHGLITIDLFRAKNYSIFRALIISHAKYFTDLTLLKEREHAKCLF